MQYINIYIYTCNDMQYIYIYTLAIYIYTYIYVRIYTMFIMIHCNPE